jgi:hypothetical protein
MISSVAVVLLYLFSHFYFLLSSSKSEIPVSIRRLYPCAYSCSVQIYSLQHMLFPSTVVDTSVACIQYARYRCIYRCINSTYLCTSPQQYSYACVLLSIVIIITEKRHHTCYSPQQYSYACVLLSIVIIITGGSGMLKWKGSKSQYLMLEGNNRYCDLLPFHLSIKRTNTTCYK